MLKTWHVTVEDQDYEIKAKFNRFLGRLYLTVNGEKIDYIPMLYAQITGFDVPIKLGNQKVILQVIGRKVDLAVEGVFLESKKTYKPFTKLPIWIWLFILFTAIMPILAGGDLIPFTISLIAIMYLIRFSVSPRIDSSWKFVISFLIVLLAWFVFGMVIMLFMEPTI